MADRRIDQDPRPAFGPGHPGSEDPPAGATATAEAPSETAGEAAFTISLETVLWGIILVSAFALRLARLDALPLTLDESSRAFASLQVSEGIVPAGWSGDLTSVLTALVFRAFGDGDAVARVVPALAGGAMVGAFWFLRPHLGRGTTLAAAALITLSPLAVLAARSGLTFSLGSLVSLIIVASLFAYLRDQRPPYFFAFVASLALAPTVDVVAIATGVSALAFLLLEGAVRGNETVRRAFADFRADPMLWLITAIVIVAALALGLTHFGTTTDKLGLAGFAQWADMFGSPGDGRFWGYQLTLLGAYDWPLTIAGGVALIAGLWRLFRRDRPVSLFMRFLLLWAVIAVAVIALATRREAGQLLILLLPFAMLAGALLDEVSAALDWSLLRRWWPALVIALLLVAFAALVLTEWSQGRADSADRVRMTLALTVAAAVLATPWTLERRGVVFPVAAVAVLAAVFAVHSSLSVVLSDGDEFAVDRRAGEHIEGFVAFAAQISAETGSPIGIDPGLREPLRWYLRDLPVAFGEPVPETAVYIAPTDAPPQGFAARGQVWRVVEGWYPPEVHLLDTWRWLLYRSAFGNLFTIDAQVYLAEP